LTSLLHTGIGVSEKAVFDIFYAIVKKKIKIKRENMWGKLSTTQQSLNGLCLRLI